MYQLPSSDEIGGELVLPHIQSNKSFNLYLYNPIRRSFLSCCNKYIQIQIQIPLVHTMASITKCVLLHTVCIQLGHTCSVYILYLKNVGQSSQKRHECECAMKTAKCDQRHLDILALLAFCISGMPHWPYWNAPTCVSDGVGAAATH